MNPRISRTLGAALASAALTTLAACSSDTGSSKPASHGDTTTEQVSRNAHAFMTAWMATSPSDGTTMCELQTKAARPNSGTDGGTLAGCIKQRREDNDTDPADNTGGTLTITISKIQDVPASDEHPAGKGALATMAQPGKNQFRYVLRLVKEGGKWLVEQTNEVGERLTQTEDPVAPVLAQHS
ncbi:hypothetical protein AB0J01_27970 [Streptomyces sp. NPDC050204]|uniref:hypothetical protein n=1 Tax=Streptomyces sp. NPDC050204 TaxID=3155514 RepID=UPI00342DE002